MNAHTAEAMEIQLDHKAQVRGALLLPGHADYVCLYRSTVSGSPDPAGDDPE